MLDSVSWVVHPLAGVALAILASVVFNPERRHLRAVLTVMGGVVLLSVLGAGWVVHPAAGLTVALLASTLFRSWRTEWRTLLGAVAALLVFSALGTGWAVFPLLGLGLAWLMKVAFSGELFRPAPQERPAAALAGAPATLPAQGGGEAFSLGAVHERVRARAERKMQKRAAKLERRAENLGLPLQVWLEKPAAEPVAPPSPPAAQAAEGLLALSRDERLPEGARARLGALHFRCREALDYLRTHGQDGAGPGFLLRQIETDYAPEAVRAYLKLPPSLAGVTPLQDGKTGRDLLTEQLDLLLSAVGDIMKDAVQAGSQHLLAHQRFLKDRFARPNDELKL